MAKPLSFSIRSTSSRKVILFIHGFGGESHQTFGMLPAFLAGDTNLTDWDIHCFGYPTKLFPDITGVWAADPELSTLAQYLLSTFNDGPYGQYEELALIAHSMGGLIVQRALLDGNLSNRVRHVFLFGTPSNGLRKASLGRIFKRQVRDMIGGGKFITQLRKDWQEKYPEYLPFNFLAVAGIRDEFVPKSSSVDVFADEHRSFVPGNHLEMVKPLSANDHMVILLRNNLLRVRPVKAIEFPSGSQIDFFKKEALRLQMLPNPSYDDFIELIFALELSGQQELAINLLASKHGGDTELTGILAGRLKRRWLADPEEHDADGYHSYRLYKEAFELASQQLDHCQAFYNGINVAFMELALYRSRYDARQMAARVLNHCKLVQKDKWKLATEGEAHLYLGDFDYAIDCYDAALRSLPEIREVDSMYKQAIWSARLLENLKVEQRLQQLFAPYIMQ